MSTSQILFKIIVFRLMIMHFDIREYMKSHENTHKHRLQCLSDMHNSWEFLLKKSCKDFVAFILKKPFGFGA